MLSGLTESEVSYFLKEPPAKAVVEQKLPSKLQNSLAAAKNNQGEIHVCECREIFCFAVSSLILNGMLKKESQHNHANSTNL